MMQVTKKTLEDSLAGLGAVITKLKPEELQTSVLTHEKFHIVAISTEGQGLLIYGGFEDAASYIDSQLEAHQNYLRMLKQRLSEAQNNSAVFGNAVSTLERMLGDNPRVAKDHINHIKIKLNFRYIKKSRQTLQAKFSEEIALTGQSKESYNALADHIGLGSTFFGAMLCDFPLLPEDSRSKLSECIKKASDMAYHCKRLAEANERYFQSLQKGMELFYSKA